MVGGATKLCLFSPPPRSADNFGAWVSGRLKSVCASRIDRIISCPKKESPVGWCTKCQRICEKPLLLPRLREPHGKILRRSHAMSGFAGFWTRRNRRRGAAGSSSRAQNFSLECAGLVVGLGAPIVETSGSNPARLKLGRSTFATYLVGDTAQQKPLQGVFIFVRWQLGIHAATPAHLRPQLLSPINGGNPRGASRTRREACT